MINLYYDKIWEGKPIPNGAAGWELSDGVNKLPVQTSRSYHKNTNVVKQGTPFYNMMKLHKVPMKLFTGNETTSNLFYPMEYLGPKTGKIYLSIPPKTFNRIKKGKMKLLLLYPQGGVDFDTMWQLKHQIGELHGKGLSQEQIYVVTGELNQCYKNLLKGINIFGIDWWQVAYQYIYKVRYEKFMPQGLLGFTDQYKALEKKKYESEFYSIDEWNYTGDKLYTSFTGKANLHNLGMVSELIKRDLFDKGNVSYNIFDNDFKITESERQRLVDKRKSQAYQNEKNKSLDFLQDKTYVIDFDQKTFGNDMYKFKKELLKDTAFSILSEKFVPFYKKQYLDELNALYVTETTWRHVAIGHPFLMLGCQTTMAHLNEEGYFTFSDLFDESYDRMSDISKKIEMIARNVSLIAKMDKEDLDKKLKALVPFLKENRRRFYYKDHRGRFEKLFRQMAY